MMCCFCWVTETQPQTEIWLSYYWLHLKGTEFIFYYCSVQNNSVWATLLNCLHVFMFFFISRYVDIKSSPFYLILAWIYFQWKCKNISSHVQKAFMFVREEMISLFLFNNDTFRSGFVVLLFIPQWFMWRILQFVCYNSF